MDPSTSQRKHKYRPVRTTEPVEPEPARTAGTSNMMQYHYTKPLPKSPPKTGSPDLHPEISLPMPLQPRILKPSLPTSTKTSKTHSARPSLEGGCTGEIRSHSTRNERSTDSRRQYMRFNRNRSDSDPSPAIGGQHHVAPTEENHGKSSTRLSHERTLVEPLAYESFPIEKDNSPEKQEFRRSMRRRRMRILCVSSVIVLLLIVTIVLLVVFVRPVILRSTHSIGQGSSPISLNQDQARCANDYLNNATLTPPSYSCTSCLPILRDVSPEFFNNSSNATQIQAVQAARQFCGVNSIFAQSSETGQANLTSLGWMKDDKICTWGGVSCDDSGSVIGLTLQFPALPQTIPNELSVMTSLSTLSIAGDKNHPTGQLGTNLPSSIRDLRLYNTSLQGFTSDAIFRSGGALAGLTALTMDGNWAMGSRIPGPILDLPMQTITVRNQNLDVDLEAIGTSAALANSLVTLDLSFNGITANLTVLRLPHLITLNLANNNIVFIPETFIFPPLIQNLDFSNNFQLHGALTPHLCWNVQLTNCSFVGTAFSTIPNIGCGPCKFR